MPYRITAKELGNAHYLSIWMPTNEEGQPFWFSASESINANTWAKNGWHPEKTDWDKNITANGDPIGEIMGQLTLTGDENAALRKAMETGIYIPFYTMAEDGATEVLRLLFLRWSFSGLGIESITADYTWKYILQADNSEKTQRFEDQEATLDDTTRIWTIAVPDNLTEMDVTVIPELAAVERILIGETDVDSLAPTDWNEWLNTHGYSVDETTGGWTKAKVSIDGVNSLPIDMYVPGEKGTEHIHVELVIERISTARTLKDGVKREDKGEITNAGEEYEHAGLLDKPINGEYLTFIPKVPGYSTATFDLSPESILANLAVESVTQHASGEIPSFFAVDPNTGSYHFEWGFSSEALDSTGVNAGYLVYVTVLSQFGQIRITQILAEENAKPEDEKLSEADLKALLEQEYLKHTWEYPVHVVPADMNLNVTVSYTRTPKAGRPADESKPEVLEFLDGAYSVFDYKENQYAENLTVTPVDNTNMKIQIWASDDQGQATGLAPLFDSTNTSVTGAYIYQMLLNRQLDTGFNLGGLVTGVMETDYVIRVISTEEGITDLYRDLPLHVVRMNSDPALDVLVTYKVDGKDVTVTATYENGVFTAPIGLQTTEATITLMAKNEYTQLMLDLLGRATDSTKDIIAKALAEYNYPTLNGYTGAEAAMWEAVWALAAKNGSTSTVELESMTYGRGVVGSTITLGAQSMAQDGTYYQNTTTNDYGYRINLIRQSNLATITIRNENKPADDEYYWAKYEGNDTYVLYLDARDSVNQTGDLTSDTYMTPAANASIRYRVKGGAWTTELQTVNFLRDPAMTRGEYEIEVRSQDQQVTKLYTLIVKDKSSETGVGFVVAPDTVNHYNIFADSAEGTTDNAYQGMAPTWESILRVVPVDPYAQIVRVVELSGGFNGSVKRDLTANNGLSYTPAGESFTIDGKTYTAGVNTNYGPAELALEAGTEQLYFQVFTKAQDGTDSKSNVYYLTLRRKDAHVEVDYVKADETTADRAGDAFNLNMAVSQMDVEIQAIQQYPDTKVTAFDVDANGSLRPVATQMNNYTTLYTVPDSVGEGDHISVPFLVRDTDFFVSEAVTPNAQKVYTMDIFRSTHDTGLGNGKILVIDPSDENHFIEAVARPDDPTIYEVAIDTTSENPIVKNNLVNVLITAENVYTTLIEVGTSGTPVESNIAQGRLEIKSRSVSGSQPTEVNFYVVSSSGVRQQWYTLRIYLNEVSTGLGKDSWQNNDTSSIVGTGLDVGGLYVNDTKLAYTDDRYYQMMDSQEAVNLTVKAYNALATVILRDSDGSVMGVKRGGGVFENVPVAKLGENNYFVTVIAAKALSYLESDRKAVSLDGETDIQALLREGKYVEAIENTDSQYKATYRVTLDYYTPDDTGINGIQIRTVGINGKVSDATLVNLGGSRGTAWMVTVPDQASSVQYTISLHNREQKLAEVDSQGNVMHSSSGEIVKKSEVGAFATSGNVTTQRFAVVAPDGKTEEVYTLYLIRGTAGVGTLQVNGEAQRSFSGSYNYTVLEGTKHVRVEAIANDERAMIQIGTAGIKTFASAIRDIDLNLNAMNSSVSIPVYVYTYPYNTVSATSYLNITRDAGKYSPGAVSFAEKAYQMDEFGRMWFVLNGSTSAGKLEVHTLSADHAVALYNDKGVEIKYAAMQVNSADDDSEGSRDYTWNLTGLKDQNALTLTIYNNNNNGAHTSYPVYIYREMTDASLSALVVDRGAATEQAPAVSANMSVILDKNQTTARIYLTTTDPNAVITALGKTGVGMLEVTKILDGSSFTATVTSSGTQIGRAHV